MNKEIFLRDLRRFLSDLPQEEREQAMKYYEDYFEDAGPDKEWQVIEELGSPAKLARQIKATGQETIEYGQGTDFHKPSAYPDVYGKDNPDPKKESPPNHGTGQDNGQPSHTQDSTQYQQSPYGPYAQDGTQYQQNAYGPYAQDGTQYQQNAYGPYAQDGTQYQQNAYGPYAQDGTQYQQDYYGPYAQQPGDNPYWQKKSRTQSPAKIVLIVVLALLAIPIGLPIIGAVFAVLFSFIAVIFSLIVAFFAAAIGLTLGGVCCVISAFVTLPGYGAASSILVVGIGLVLLSVGILLFWVGILCGSKLLPIFAGIIAKCYQFIVKGCQAIFQ